MKIIQDLCSEAGYLVWSSADGTELIIGAPNYSQEMQFLIANPGENQKADATANRLHFKESVADRYSLIMALGSGRGDAANYGASTVTRRDVVTNGPGIDGTGVDFIFPKRLILAERTLLNIEEAKQYAQREMNRRDFHKMIVTANMPAHGQISAGSTPSLYAPNTLARVIDGEQDLPVDGAFMIYTCKYKSTRDGGESTELSLVPRGTVFAQ
jgi:prophage tail gpP-like protein